MTSSIRRTGRTAAWWRFAVATLVPVMLWAWAIVPALAQDGGGLTEGEVRFSLTCISAQGVGDTHVHLVGGGGRPARYLVPPALRCNEMQPVAEVTTIWRPGSIWHVVVRAEVSGGGVTCEGEGMQLPVEVHCPVRDGAVVFAISLDDGTIDASPTPTPDAPDARPDAP